MSHNRTETTALWFLIMLAVALIAVATYTTFSDHEVKREAIERMLSRANQFESDNIMLKDMLADCRYGSHGDEEVNLVEIALDSAATEGNQK
jgi:hypothetical protein